MPRSKYRELEVYSNGTVEYKFRYKNGTTIFYTNMRTNERKSMHESTWSGLKLVQVTGEPINKNTVPRYEPEFRRGFMLKGRKRRMTPDLEKGLAKAKERAEKIAKGIPLDE